MILNVIIRCAISYIVIEQQTPGLLRAPALPSFFQSLDALLIQSWTLLRTARNLISSPLTLVEDLHKGIKEARLMNEDFSTWAASQPEEWKPRSIGSVHRQQCILTHNLSWLSGQIDAYLDCEYQLYPGCLCVC
jgi:hypothetical protein